MIHHTLECIGAPVVDGYVVIAWGPVGDNGPSFRAQFTTLLGKFVAIRQRSQGAFPKGGQLFLRKDWGTITIGPERNSESVVRAMRVFFGLFPTLDTFMVSVVDVSVDDSDDEEEDLLDVLEQLFEEQEG